MTFDKIHWHVSRPNVFVATFDRASARVKPAADGAAWVWSVCLDEVEVQGTAATRIGAQAFAERALRYGVAGMSDARGSEG